MIASFTNHKPYPSPLPNLTKQGPILHSHLIQEKDFDINKIKVETACFFWENFTNIKRVVPELPSAETKTLETLDIKTLRLEFVTKQLNDMKDSTLLSSNMVVA